VNAGIAERRAIVIGEYMNKELDFSTYFMFNILMDSSTDIASVD
jgi:hypothetical protein